MERLTRRNTDGYVCRESNYISDADAWNKLAHYEDLEEQGLLLTLPCKVGDWIHSFRFTEEKGRYFLSDKITSVTTNRNGYTIKTKSVFYPIKEGEYDIAPIKEFPNAFADFYVGTKEQAEQKLAELNAELNEVK